MLKPLLLLLLLVAAPAWAGPPVFIRSDSQALQTPICHYRRGDLRVDLIGVIHVGEVDYYRQLDQRLGRYPAVLYELIAQPPGDPNRAELYDLVGMKAPRANPLPQPGSTDNPTTAFQRQLGHKLGLRFQLDEIDYARSNFIHADITPGQLEKLLDGHQESLSERFQKLARLNPQGNPLELLGLWLGPTSPTSRLRLRRALAPSLMDLKGSYQAMQGKEATAYIDARNLKALKVLKQEIGSGCRHAAIFYGAAHLPDFHRRLTRDFGLRWEGQEWLSAWKLR